MSEEADLMRLSNATNKRSAGLQKAFGTVKPAPVAPVTPVEPKPKKKQLSLTEKAMRVAETLRKRFTGK